MSELSGKTWQEIENLKNRFESGDPLTVKETHILAIRLCELSQLIFEINKELKAENKELKTSIQICDDLLLSQDTFTKENFFDAIRRDKDMSDEDKKHWLEMETGTP